MTSTAAPGSTHSDLDLASVAKRAWALFAEKPIEHVVGAFVVFALGTVSLGLLLGPMLVAYLRLIDRQRRGEAVSLSQLFELQGTLSALIASILLAVTVGLGLLFFVVPGLVALLAWGYCFWFIALAGEDATTSMSSSWRLLKARTGSVVAVWVVLVLVNAAGAVAGFVGGLLTLPLGTLFATVAFTDMRQ